MKFEFKEGRLKYTVYLDENECCVACFDGGGGYHYSFPIGYLQYWIEIESKSGASDNLIAILKNEDKRIKLNSILI